MKIQICIECTDSRLQRMRGNVDSKAHSVDYFLDFWLGQPFGGNLLIDAANSCAKALHEPSGAKD